MIKVKEFTVSHLDLFNRINVSSVNGLIILLHNASAKREFWSLRLSQTNQYDLEEIDHDPEDVCGDELVVDHATTLECLSSLHPLLIDDVDEIIRLFSVVRCALA